MDEHTGALVARHRRALEVQRAGVVDRRCAHTSARRQLDVDERQLAAGLDLERARRSRLDRAAGELGSRSRQWPHDRDVAADVQRRGRQKHARGQFDPARRATRVGTRYRSLQRCAAVLAVARPERQTTRQRERTGKHQNMSEQSASATALPALDRRARSAPERRREPAVPAPPLSESMLIESLLAIPH